MNAVIRHRLTWPALALVLLLLLNQVFRSDFLAVRVQDGHLYGSLIDILRNGAPTILIALGMTLVIASRGIDLSVGATAAIAGAISCTYIYNAADPGSAQTALTGAAIAVGAGLALGAWNGFLVAVIGIQPIIATLVLMTAGRGLAQLVTDGQIITVSNDPYHAIGAGFFLALPISILIAAAVCAAAGLLTRRTALGTLIEAVGINPVASRLAGLNARTITWIVYIFSGFCAAVAGLMISSNVTAADANNAGLFIEMDAILAVVIGGTSLAGGRYSLVGTLIGALIIQTLTTTVYTLGIPPEVTLVFKALVVIVVCLLQSPKARTLLRQRKRPATTSSKPKVAI
ncbi:ABC transporter permease [Arthrobacter sp. zg-Y820]|uniref:ABC transporter permease n=1 Tax=unclassified Arthrobacter TaxID=235627 RepID=UPI001E388749|nr:MULTISPECIES: ABC transporter permease [unclassified Arthrobacter]MCC9197602.1 ABC transporter permease [Arthrobacter sp. zg-Y820]MDK1280469.1 ABC transporter permease [Arthrobacter sp. zg.Y820]MDK1361985.1 ABC transporter permease [Arthrobacter sp. zg-Y1219]WIB10889.1 ABC transporter permease [Arthrobacter sp. zg-Y820]